MGSGIKVEGKYNCPATGCNAHSDDVANLVQHIGRKHKLREKYLIIDRDSGRIWTQDRLPTIVTDKGKEILKEATKLEAPIAA